MSFSSSMTELSGVVIAFTASAIILAIKFQKKDPNKEKYPPTASIGVLEAINGLSGLRAPWFLLDLARNKTKTSSSDIFYLPIPMAGGVCIVNNPTVAREILTDPSTDKAPAFYARFNKIAGFENILTRSSNAQWKAVRKGTAHAFSSSQVGRMNRICAKHVENWIAESLEPLVRNDVGSGSSSSKKQPLSFDPSVEMTRLTFGAIMESAFEYIPTEEEYNLFMHHIDKGTIEFAQKHGLNPFRFLYAFLDPSYWDAVKSCRYLRAFAQKVLNTYRDNPNKSSHDTLIKLLEKNETLKTDRERVAEMLIFMVAGFDTTGYTLSNTLNLLARHPRVAEKLQRELSSMEPEQWSQSKYLQCVIRESERILPVSAFGSVVVTGRDFTFHDKDFSTSTSTYGGQEMVVPKNTNVFLFFILSHRHAATFENPDEFHPERWDSDSDATNKTMKMKEAFMLFSLGNRNCPGQSLAKAELLTVLPRLLVSYRFHVESEGTLEFFLTLKYIGARLSVTRVR